jgi:enhancing lycopene biosynthesis protein 2
MKKIAVVLSGCGHRDGSEITEAVSTLIALGEANASYQIFAPNMAFSVVNALTGDATPEKRNLLMEAARIARGDIKDVAEIRVVDFDGIVFPGGFGAALNLCSFAKDGASCSVNPDVERVIQEFHEADKPIGAICIAPALIARVLGSKGVTVTIGKDVETAKEIEKTGAIHEECAITDYVTDRGHKIITTPAYMFEDATPVAAFTGIRGAIHELVGMS